MPSQQHELLAHCAHAFEHKLATLDEALDPSHLGALPREWVLLGQVGNERLRHRIAARLARTVVAPWPRLTDLLQREARLALLDRGAILNQLCLLALAGRPGVVRCCLRREPREALRSALGPAFDALSAAGGRAVEDEVAQWSPLEWACMGYLDWLELLGSNDPALGRLVSLSLPAGLLSMPQRRDDAPAERSPREALNLLQELDLEWSC